MGLWARVFAAGYDRFSAGAERAGLGAARQQLLARTRGRVLEIGAGTGINVEHYPPGTDVVFTEPEPHMARRLRARGVEVIGAGAEALPFPDASFDTVVSTFVLCTVPDVPATLRELRRVLAPGGQLLFIEHVRGQPGSGIERWQNRLHGPWRVVACGCHCDRDLRAAIASEFTIADVRDEEWPFMAPITRRVVTGSAG